ncbi:tight adherence protein B [Elusimicrobium simillimum]|uniref:type II secretion system F family protein n=1 Tax=Elusimicrobium simillimum TaxID=3143438 RepID=UPI003C6F32B0
MKKILFLTLCAVLLSTFARAAAFSSEEQRIVSCARERTYILYRFLDPKIPVANKSYTLSSACGGSEDKPITPPQWLLTELPKMEERAVAFNQKDQKTQNEADVWMIALANIIEYLKNTEQMFDPKYISTPDKLADSYMKQRAQFVSSIDKLNTPIKVGKTSYSVSNSFEGRARSLIPTLELINNEMDSTVSAFAGSSVEREDKFRLSAVAVAMLANNFYGQFFMDPLPLVPDPNSYTQLRTRNNFALILMMIGTVVVFFGTLYYIMETEDQISASIDKYMKRTNTWAEDFNRQFIAVNVKYIVIGTVLFFAFFGLLFGFAMGGFTGVIAFLIVTGVGVYLGKNMPGFVLKRMKQFRGSKISSQLMDSLILLSNSLKAGMDIVQAFEMVSKDMKPPISDEFGLVIKNYQLGASFEAALETMEDRIENRMLSYMIKAIILQRQVGGNLTKIFERIVETIREESKLEDKLQSMTAQQRIQSIVVSLMPWLMVGVMFLFRPDEMFAFYSTGIGFFLLLFCFIWIMIGMKMISKIGEIKV